MSEDTLLKKSLLTNSNERRFKKDEEAKWKAEEGSEERRRS